jgi:endonuclease/exonuclease/phosphatase family metal-dependent hydrolase
MQIKVMTFNLRVDVPVDGIHQWRYRVPSVLLMIDQHQPDIIFFQEVTPAMMTDLQALEQIYGYYFVGRNADKLGEGCPIYFRKSLFQIKLADTIWLTQTPRTPGSLDPEEGYPRIASEVILQYQKGPLYRFVNTHLAYRSKKAKDMNMKVLFDFIQSFPDPIPTILGGDFNESIQVIKKYAPRTLLFALTSEHGNTLHDFLGGQGVSQIDHILYQLPFKLTSVEVDRTLPLSMLPSDHYPVIGVLTDES